MTSYGESPGDRCQSKYNSRTSHSYGESPGEGYHEKYHDSSWQTVTPRKPSNPATTVHPREAMATANPTEDTNKAHVAPPPTVEEKPEKNSHTSERAEQQNKPIFPKKSSRYKF